MGRDYQDMCWPDIEAMDREKTIILIPVGATEQHGHHLPLGTDTLDAQCAAERILAQLEPEFKLLLFPMIPVGLSVEHMAYPGTVTFQPDTYYRMLKEICDCLVRHGFRKLVFLNGHGGNSDTLNNVAYTVRSETGAGVFIIDISILLAQPDKPVEVRTDPGCDSHAGELESALVLVSRPEAVRMERAVPTRPEKFLGNQVFTLEGPVGMGWLANDLSAAGNCGNPTFATKEQGEKMMAYIVEKACTALHEIAAWDASVTPRA